MSKNGATLKKPAVLLKVKDSSSRVRSKKIKNTVSLTKATHRDQKSLKNLKTKVTVGDDSKKVKADSPQTTFALPSAIVVRNNLQLALLSPFRLPIDNDRLASQVARYAGVFFVVAGALFTLFHMQSFGGTYANLESASLVAQSTGSNYNCSDTASPNYDAVYCATNETANSSGTSGSSVDPTPPVDFLFEGVSPYANIVPITIIVPYATSVDVHAYQKTTGTSITLGRAVNVSSDIWRFFWDTRGYTDGEYRIKALVKNAYGTYNHTESSNIFVENYPVTTASDAETGSSTSTGSTTSTPPPATTTVSTPTTTTAATSVPLVQLTINEAPPLKGYVTMETSVIGATGVKLYVKSGSSSNYSLLGYATYHNGTEWRFEWNTALFPKGTYTVRAQALFTGASYQSNEVTTSIDNATPATNASSTATTTATAALEPQILIQIPKPSPLDGDVDVFVTVSDATFVELYVQPTSALTPLFLGRAQKQNDDTWKFKWPTKQTPNGNYKVFARVKHQYGVTESTRIPASIVNAIVPVHTEAETAKVVEIQQIHAELEDTTYIAGTTKPQSSGTSSRTSNVPPIYMTSATAVMDEIDISDSVERENLETELRRFRLRIQEDLHRFAQAVRKGDEAEMEKIRNDIEHTRKEILASITLTGDTGETRQLIDTHLRKVTDELENLAIRNETIIKERMPEVSLIDSDKDGLSDYDEANLYHTDPFSADTDKDSFIDGTEIVSGYDPNNSVAQVLIAYESPKEMGIIRDDLLTVETIFSLKETEEGEVSEIAEGAIITGKGLPNSFVTLYIFSTPIVVTVKTDTDGSWSYIFDKELDNGEHEVYVGLTDNAGRIVAKSNPLTFIKTAEAFTPIDATSESAIVGATHEPTLFNQNIMLVVVSVTVVALGLVLILLGLYVNNSRRIIPQVSQ